MVGIKLSDIDRVEASKPNGYRETLLASGTVKDGVIYLHNSKYQELRRQFSPDSVTTNVPNCCGSKPSLPSVTRMATNVIGASARVLGNVLTGEKVKASKEEQERRLTICKGCEFYIKEKDRCSKCGCYSKWKAALASEHCPLPIPKW